MSDYLKRSLSLRGSELHLWRTREFGCWLKSMELRRKRAYVDPDAADGLRVLVDGLWPRGVSKQRAAVRNHAVVLEEALRAIL